MSSALPRTDPSPCLLILQRHSDALKEKDNLGKGSRWTIDGSCSGSKATSLHRSLPCVHPLGNDNSSVPPSTLDLTSFGQTPRFCSTGTSNGRCPYRASPKKELLQQTPRLPSSNRRPGYFPAANRPPGWRLPQPNAPPGCRPSWLNGPPGCRPRYDRPSGFIQGLTACPVRLSVHGYSGLSAMFHHVSKLPEL